MKRYVPYSNEAVMKTQRSRCILLEQKHLKQTQCAVGCGHDYPPPVVEFLLILMSSLSLFCLQLEYLAPMIK